eukprot:8744243-Heterocapsa_arctica.AAC.1
MGGLGCPSLHPCRCHQTQLWEYRRVKLDVFKSKLPLDALNEHLTEPTGAWRSDCREKGSPFFPTQHAAWQ